MGPQFRQEGSGSKNQKYCGRHSNIGPMSDTGEKVGSAASVGGQMRKTTSLYRVRNSKMMHNSTRDIGGDPFIIFPERMISQGNSGTKA